MDDQEKSTFQEERDAKIAEVRACLESKDRAMWNQGIREILVRLVDRKAIWFDTAGEVVERGEKDGQYPALVELVIHLTYEVL